MIELKKFELNKTLNTITFEDDILNQFVREFAFLHDIDEELVKIYLYAFLCNAIADKVILNPTTDENYYISPNLWAAIISPPGTRKSVILEFFKKLSEYNTKFLDIATKEAIIEEMSKIKHGIFAVDELSLLLNKIKNDAEYRSFILTGWNGYSRISKKTVSKENFDEVTSIGIIGNIQPDPFFKLVLQDNLNDGLIQRFQLLYFNTNYKNTLIMYSPPSHIFPHLKNIFKILNNEKLNLLLKNKKFKTFQNRFIITPTLNAQRLFVINLNFLRKQYKNNHDNKLHAFLGKIDKVVGSIALIHAILRGIRTENFEVTKEDIFKGFEFAKYSLYQFFNINEYFNSNNKQKEQIDLRYKVLRKLIQRKTISKRELIQQISGLNTVSDVNKVLSELEKDNIKFKIEKNKIII